MALALTVRVGDVIAIGDDVIIQVTKKVGGSGFRARFIARRSVQIDRLDPETLQPKKKGEVVHELPAAK